MLSNHMDLLPDELICLILAKLADNPDAVSAFALACQRFKAITIEQLKIKRDDNLIYDGLFEKLILMFSELYQYKKNEIDSKFNFIPRLLRTSSDDPLEDRLNLKNHFFNELYKKNQDKEIVFDKITLIKLFLSILFSILSALAICLLNNKLAIFIFLISIAITGDILGKVTKHFLHVNWQIDKSLLLGNDKRTPVTEDLYKPNFILYKKLLASDTQALLHCVPTFFKRKEAKNILNNSTNSTGINSYFSYKKKNI